MKTRISKRHKTRRLAVQALYQWQMTQADVGEILTEFLAHHSAKTFDSEYFQQLVRGVIDKSNDLDISIQLYSPRPLAQIDPVERAVLRLAAYELLYSPELPFRVIINESLELAKTFGSIEGYKFVNGVIDPLAKHLRAQDGGNNS
jgi:N utilization substance protein B